MATQTELHMEVESIGDGLVVRPAGEVDLRRASALGRALQDVQAQQPSRLVVDLAGVTWIDSPVVAILIQALRRARRHGGIVVLCGLTPIVRSVFEIARLDEGVFTIVDDVEAAIAVPHRRDTIRVRPGEIACRPGRLLDVSRSGVRLRCRRRLRGTIALRLARGDDVLRIRARVVWVNRIGFLHHEIGLHFVDVDEPARAALEELVDPERARGA